MITMDWLHNQKLLVGKLSLDDFMVVELKKAFHNMFINTDGVEKIPIFCSKCMKSYLKKKTYIFLLIYYEIKISFRMRNITSN